MARQLRIEFHGASYHVTSRGNLKDRIFFSDADKERFLDIVKRTKERYSYSLHAYALMDNHYHLLIETPLPNLSRIMQNINTSYSVYVNRKYSRAGHLFQGRFKAIIVDKDSYLLQLSRYIHLNPVRAGIVRSPNDYKWTSYRKFIEDTKCEMIEVTDTLNHFSVDIDVARTKYREFVESDQENQEGNGWSGDVRAGTVLGGEEFFRKVKSLISRKDGDDELPSLRELHKLEVPFDGIVDVLGESYGDEVLKGKRKGNIRRDLGIYLLKNLSGRTNVEVGRFFGIRGAAVSLALKRAEEAIENSPDMRREFEELKERCLDYN